MPHLVTARRAWHDASHPRFAHALAAELLQSAEHSAHQQSIAMAMAGRIQDAISRIRPAYLIPFGDWLYAPAARPTDRIKAEDLVHLFAVDKHRPMRGPRRGYARDLAAGVLGRYRQMHQGGLDRGDDPYPTAEAFRAHLNHKLQARVFRSESWARDWGDFERICFEVCADLDRQALRAVAQVLLRIRE